MSIRCNQYERNLVNRLQRNMSKREAENALYEIRLNLYNDEYQEISQEITYDNYGHSKFNYPPVKALLWAYYNGNYEIPALRDFVGGE